MVDKLTEKEIALRSKYEELLIRREALVRSSERYFEHQERKMTKIGPSYDQAMQRNDRLLKEVIQTQQAMRQKADAANSQRLNMLRNNYWAMVRNVFPIWYEELLDYEDGKLPAYCQNVEPRVQACSKPSKPNIVASKASTVTAKPSKQAESKSTMRAAGSVPSATKEPRSRTPSATAATPASAASATAARRGSKKTSTLNATGSTPSAARAASPSKTATPPATRSSTAATVAPAATPSATAAAPASAADAADEGEEEGNENAERRRRRRNTSSTSRAHSADSTQSRSLARNGAARRSTGAATTLTDLLTYL